MEPTKPRAYSYIRFSTPEQAKGASLSRQRRLTREYVIANNLELDRQLTFKDLGLSAFTQQNLEPGAELRRFIDLVKAGVVPRGSYLLIESLDRLTRATIYTAMSLLGELLDQGIIVVTLLDKMRYEKTGTKDDFPGLIISMAILQRANEESETKRTRLNDAWERKRGNISTKKLTRLCPAWLTLAEDGSRYLEIPERVEVVREIITLTRQGVGKQRIATILNERGVKSIAPSRVDRKAEAKAQDLAEGWDEMAADEGSHFIDDEGVKPDPNRRSKANLAQGWHASYIRKLLSNRALIGEFQPHKLEPTDGLGGPNARTLKRRRRPYGPPIPDYFPALLSEDQFAVLQAEIAKRGTKVGGRRGADFANLFMGLLRCGYCDGPMVYINKGADTRRNRDSRRNRFFVCSTARRGLGCHKVPWVYHEFEESFFAHATKTDFTDFLKSSESRIDERNLREELTATEQRLAHNHDTRKRLVDMLTGRDTTGLDDVMDKIAELKAESAKLSDVATKTRAALALAGSANRDTQDVINMLGELRDQVTAKVGAEHYAFRANLNQHLRQLIDAITLYPGGLLSTESERATARAKLLDSGHDALAVDATVNLMFRTAPVPADRCYVISNRGKDLQVLHPDAKTPDFEERLKLVRGKARG